MSGVMLSDAERRVFAVRCFDHAVATCQVRRHLLGCLAVAAALEERIESSHRSLKESGRLRTASAILAAESQALAQRVLGAKRL